MADQDRMMALQQELLELRIADWHEKVISFQWFFLVFMLIVPWIIWWKLVDRKRILEIFSFGLLVSVISSFLNANGLDLILWTYPYKLIPFSPRAYVFSLSLIPVAFMLLYQYFPKWKPFAVATTIMAAAVAFVVQPILSWLDIYQLIRWNYFFSFLVLLFIGLGSRLLHQLVHDIRFKNEEKASGEERRRLGLFVPAFKKKKDDL